jgi:hypothetical protein
MASRALTLLSLSLLPLCRAAQPSRKGTPGSFEVVGESGVSAQQLFLGAANKVRINSSVSLQANNAN